MNKFLLVVFIGVYLFSCNPIEKNMIINGKINGFQKGKIYLEKIIDTTLVKVDSVLLDGKNNFILSDNIDSPEMYYISISESDKYLKFFGEKGKIDIISDLKTFGYKPLIEGSKNQILLEEFNKTNRKFNNLKLDLIKERFDIQQQKNSDKLQEIDKKIKNTEKRQYLYTINYAVNNADYEVSPYLVLTHIRKVNPKFLDTIEKAMSEKVKKSLYGQKFNTFLTEVKNQ